MDPQRELTPDAVFRLDFRRSLDEVPDEILALLPLFDGRRTLTQWVKASRLPPATAREVVETLRRRQVIAERLDDSERDDGPELADWLAAGTLAHRRPRRRQLAMAAAGLLVTIGIAAAAVGSRKTESTPVAALAAAAVVAPPVVAEPPPIVAEPPVVAEPPLVVAVAPPVVAAPPIVAAAPTTVLTPPAPEPMPVVDASALTDEGKRLYARGKLKQAIASLEKAVTADPASDGAWVALAKCHLDLGANAKALTESRQAAGINERNADAYIIMGTVQQQSGRTVGAKAAFKKYVELVPKGEFAAEIRTILKTL